MAFDIGADLEQIEKWIRQIQIEWEKFFGGIEKKQPSELRAKLEAVIRRYGGIEIRNNVERFRYQTLCARYNTLNELWSKRVRAIEEGRPVGLHLTRALVESLPVAPPPDLAPELKPVAPPPSRAAAAAAASLKEYRIQNPTGDALMVKALYRQFVDERKKAGETAALNYDNFEKLIGQQATRILTEKGAQAVDFRIETKDGKVSLKAKPVK
jgi:hypothetical protein